jgi:hypothetical protein
VHSTNRPVRFVERNKSLFFLFRWHARCKGLNDAHWWLSIVVFGKINQFLVWEVKTDYSHKPGCAASCCMGQRSCPAWCRASGLFEAHCILDIIRMKWAVYIARHFVVYYARGLQNPGARSHGRLNFFTVAPNIFGSPDGACFMSPFWRLDF